MSQIVGDLTLKVFKDKAGHPIPTRDGRAQWVAVDPPIEYVDDAGNRIINPSGEPTDLGSIPQIAWSLGFSPDGIGVEGFAIHDLLYRTRGTCLVGGVRHMTRAADYTRPEADAVLRDILKTCGVGLVRRNLIYAAVRVGGASGWGD